MSSLNATNSELFINLPRRQLTLKGQPIHLTKLEFDFLAYLIKNRNRVCTYDELLAEVWEYVPGASNSSVIRLTVCRVRKKLDTLQTGLRMTTIRGVGVSLDLTTKHTDLTF